MEESSRADGRDSGVAMRYSYLFRIVFNSMLRDRIQPKFEPAIKSDKFDHVWYWHAQPMRPINRKGQRCRVLVSGAKNSVLVEFPDGFKVVTSRYAVRRISTR